MTLRQFDRLDPDERGHWVADWIAQQATCPDCARPVAECSDPEKIWYPQRRICYATMERQAAVAQYGDLHQERPFHDGTFTAWAKDRSKSHPYHFSDGVSVWVAAEDVAPWDEFTTQVDASPVESVAEQAPGEQD